MKHILFGLVAATALTACASNSKIQTDNVSAISSDNKGAILATYGGKTSCHKISLVFTNVDTGESIGSEGLSAGWMQSNENVHEKVSVIPVSPGMYKYKGGTCVLPDGGTYYFKGVTHWFKPFEVKAGEAVYPGTLIAEAISHKVDGVMDFVPDFIMRAPTDDYQVFDQEDRTTLVRRRLAEDAPELTDKFVTRLAPQRLETSTIKQILADAYASESKKDRPDSRVASRQVRLALAKYIISGKYSPAPK